MSKNLEHSQPQDSNAFSNPLWKFLFIFNSKYFYQSDVSSSPFLHFIFIFFFFFLFLIYIYILSSVLLFSLLLSLHLFSLSLQILHLGHFDFLGKSHFSEKVQIFSRKLRIPKSVASTENTI